MKILISALSLLLVFACSESAKPTLPPAFDNEKLTSYSITLEQDISHNHMERWKVHAAIKANNEKEMAHTLLYIAQKVQKERQASFVSVIARATESSSKHSGEVLAILDYSKDGTMLGDDIGRYYDLKIFRGDYPDDKEREAIDLYYNNIDQYKDDLGLTYDKEKELIQFVSKELGLSLEQATPRSYNQQSANDIYDQ